MDRMHSFAHLFRYSSHDLHSSSLIYPSSPLLISLLYSYLQSLHGFPPLPSLRVLALAQNSIANAFLPFLPSLSSLYLDHNPVSVLPAATSVPNLAALSVSHTPLASLEPLRHYASSLKRLNIANTRVTDLSLLSHFKQLTHLTIDGCLIDASTLSSLPKSLIHLSLKQCRLGDVRPSLSSSSSSATSTLSASDTLILPDLPALTHLSLARNSLKRFPDFHGCPNLRYLDISNTLISAVHDEFVPDDVQIVKIAGSPCAADEITRIVSNSDLLHQHSSPPLRLMFML